MCMILLQGAREEFKTSRDMAMSDPADANMANLMIQSQESHLLSPEISAAGSDSGHVEDLKGHSFSSLVEAEATKRTSLAAKEAVTKTAATPSFRQRQQTSLSKAPAANPSTCSNTTATTTTRKSKSNSKSDPSQPTQKPSTRTTKSNNDASAKMAPTKSTQASSRRRPTPINVQLVRASSSSSSQASQSSSTSTNGQLISSQYGPAHAFTMTLLPMTKIRELCLHASAHARRHLDLVLDGSRLEARDRDGHIFKGHETISEEILSGETIYLVEGGLDARGAAAVAKAAAVAVARSSSASRGAGSERPKSRSRERGRLLCLKSLELEGGQEEGMGREERVVAKTPYRTPSVSSRASSSSQASKGKKASEPRMTPSQRALAIAEMGLATTAAAQEPIIPKKRPVRAAAVKKSLPSPALEKVGECSDADQAPGDDTLVGEPDEADDVERTLVAASPEAAVRISTPPPSSPKKQQQRDHHHHEVPPNLQDSQLVIPDSQDPFSQNTFSQQSVESHHPAAPAASTPEIPEAPKTHPQHPPRVKAAATTTTERSLPTSKPDPYDINNVLSDEEGLLSDESNHSRTLRMAPSVRKLGSATASRKIVAPPPVSLPSLRPQSNPPSPSRANEAGVAMAASAKTSTPTRKAATPIKVDPSSPAAPLPSSPTTHVAAAIAKGGQPRRDRTPQRPSPGQAVIRVPSSDSEDDDDGFIEDDDLVEAAFLNMSASNKSPASLPWSQPPLRAASGGEPGVEKQLTPRRRLPDSAAPEVKGPSPMAKLAPSATGSPKKSPVKKSAPPSPGKRYAQRDFVKASSLITRPSKREEATIVHDSESEYERDNPFVVKEEPRNPSMSGHLKQSRMEMPPPPLPRRVSSQRSPAKSSAIITSPSKREEATVIQDTSSADSEDEQDIRPVKKEEAGEELSPFLKRKLADIPAIDEKTQQEQNNQHEVIELSSGSDSDYDLLDDMLEEEEDRSDPEPEPELPIIDTEPPVQEAQTPLLPQGPAPIDPPPLPEEPMTDPVKIEPDCEEAPPSAQTSKRKRDTSEEPDPEEEKRERKRAKNRANKARKKQNREQRATMLRQQQQQEEDELAALEEERKKIALERAHRRALELEIMVSSPVKRELSLELREEADDDDSGVGSSPPSDDTSAGGGVPLDRDDKNDSLSSKDTEDNRPSWRKLSKTHLSSSPTNGCQNGPGEDGVGHLAAPPTSTPAIIEAQLQQCVEERFHRMAFDDWAFLENTLGKGLGGGYGHSTLEVHNRVHLDMMHRAQHPPIQVLAMQEEQSTARDEPQNEPSEPSAATDHEDDAPARARSQRSEAPSPKEHRVMEQAQAQEQDQEIQEQEIKQEEPKHEETAEETAERRKQKKKTQNRLRHERARKAKCKRLAKGRYHQDFRTSHANLLEQKKQKQKQKKQKRKQARKEMMSRETD